MTIHSEHPFLDPDPDPVRRFRGRLGGAVSLVTAGAGRERAGLTVSSLLVANGDPAQVVMLVDPDSDLHDVLTGPATRSAVVQLLSWR
ncbi:MAG TPA: flavin reductase, partial [Nocardioides sp.]|nr:flavin reductase [Nocardioides sp.]